MNSSIIPFYKQIAKVIVKSKGCYLYDSEGKQYIDFESGDWAANLGHSHDRINQVIKNQADKLIHDGLRFRNKESEDLSEKLLEKLDLKEGKSVFLNSGSEAVNLGITIAKNLTQRNKILKMDCSYLSAFGYGKISPDNTDLLNISIEDTDSISQFNFRGIAAFVFEPGNSSSLIKYPSNGFIKAIALKVKQNGGMLMANEVTTGFGRTGKWFGFQHYDYNPDIVSVGKALGNGYPISGVSISQEISDLFNKSPFRYAQSHQNDALGCAVGLEVMKVFDDEKIVNNCFEKGLYFSDRLKMLQIKCPVKVKEIRARGLMLALEFYSNIDVEKIYLQLIDYGFLVGFKENVLRFMPPLVVENQHINSLIDAIEKILENK
jgi:acetylornithine aminotransferase